MEAHASMPGDAEYRLAHLEWLVPHICADMEGQTPALRRGLDNDGWTGMF
jgi:hypothetical protein